MRLVSLAVALPLAFGSLAGCSKTAPPPAPHTSASEAVRLEAAPTAPAAAAVPASVNPLTTTKPADPSRMPLDALHAGLAREPSNHLGGGALPAGHPPLPGAPTPAPEAPAVEAGGDLPLPLRGAGSAAELERRKPSLAALDEAVRERLFQAFRLSFTAQRDRRDYAEASRLVSDLVGDPTAGPMASRILGAVALNTGFDTEGATAHYKKAVEKDPAYGEAHYALAFMLSMSDLESARRHFAEASRLGVEDASGLAGRLGSGGH